MEEKFAKKFTRCPMCALKEELAKMLKKPELVPDDSGVGFCKYLTEKAKKKGLATPIWELFMDKREGVVFDPNKTVLMPIGAKVPVYYITTDVCMVCGTLYAVELVELEGIISTQDASKGNIPQTRA